MISWSLGGAVCGTIVGVLVGTLFFSLGRDSFAEKVGGGVLGGFYGGVLVGVTLGVLDQSHPPSIKAYGGIITGTIGAAIGAVISAFTFGGASGAVAAGATWGLLSGVLGSLMGGIAGIVIGQRGFTQRTQRNNIASRIGYWALPGAISAAIGGPLGRVLDTPDLVMGSAMLWEAVGAGVVGGAVGSIVIALFIVFAYDLQL